MDKLNRGMEHFWLAVTLAATIYAIYRCLSVGWETEYANFFIPVVAFLWFMTRRMMRKRAEKQQRDRQ